MKQKIKHTLLIISLLVQINFLFAQKGVPQVEIVERSEVIAFLAKNDIENTELALSLARQNNYTNEEYLALQQLAQLYKNFGNTPISLRYSLEYLNLIQDTDAVKQKYNAACTVGDIYFEEKLFNNALEYYRQAERLPNFKSETQIPLWEKMGSAYRQNFQLDSALIFYNKTSDFFEGKGNFKKQIENWKSIAEIYEDQENCERALYQNLKIQKLLIQYNQEKLIGKAANNIGYNYHCMNDFENAVTNFELAEKRCEDANCEIDYIVLQSNLSIAHFNLGNIEKGFGHLDKAIKRAKKEKNQKQLAELNHLKATIFFRQKDWYQAQIHNQDAIAIAQEGNFPESLNESYLLAARIHQELYEFEPALDFYEKHLSLRDSLLLEERLRQQDLAQQQFLLERSEKEIKLLLVNQKVQELNIRELEKQRSILRLQGEKLALETKRKEDELALLKQEQEIKEERLKTQELEAARSKQQLQLARQQLEAAEKDRSIAELEQLEALQKQELAQQKAQEEAQKAKIENLENQKEIDRLQIEQQQTVNQAFIGAGVALLAILGVILFSFLNARKKSRQLAKQNQEIETQKAEIEKSRDLVEKERAKSENLLLNILPVETAKELKETGVAIPKTYENVSVLFTDFIGFTRISETMQPAQVIEELNTCFSVFDEIIERHGLEKIKTMGDAYMCVSGLSNASENNAQQAAAAALEMQSYIKNRHQEKINQRQNYWKMRVGIHTGSVVAGVIGSKKFAYDIWGDTVNLASRMESNGEANRVNVSAATFEEIKNQFRGEFRGEIEVKNRGKVGMYFINTK